MPHMSHICQLVYVHIWHFYVSIKLTAIKNVNRNSGIHTFYNIGIYPWKICMPHCTYVPLHGYCSLHIDPKNKTKQQFATLVYHPTATYVLTTDMPLKCDIYASFFMWRYQKTMAVYIPHMNSLQSTLSPQALVYIQFKLLAYAPNHICLLHQTCMSHCSSNIVYMKIPITAHNS